MSSSTADALGLSRAILCNDTLVKKMQELQHTELMYRGLVDHCKRMLQVKFFFELKTSFLSKAGEPNYSKLRNKFLFAA